MAFKAPEDRKITPENSKSYEAKFRDFLQYVDLSYHPNDGYYAIPKMGATGPALKNSKYFLCRATVVDGWQIVAINIPTEGRSPSWEEQHWVRQFFFDKQDAVIMVHPGPQVYVDDAIRWVHLWRPVDTTVNFSLPPIFSNLSFRDASFTQKLVSAVKSKLKGE